MRAFVGRAEVGTCCDWGQSPGIEIGRALPDAAWTRDVRSTVMRADHRRRWGFHRGSVRARLSDRLDHPVDHELSSSSSHTLIASLCDCSRVMRALPAGCTRFAASERSLDQGTVRAVDHGPPDLRRVTLKNAQRRRVLRVDALAVRGTARLLCWRQRSGRSSTLRVPLCRL